VNAEIGRQPATMSPRATSSDRRAPSGRRALRHNFSRWGEAKSVGSAQRRRVRRDAPPSSKALLSADQKRNVATSRRMRRRGRPCRHPPAVSAISHRVPHERRLPMLPPRIRALCNAVRLLGHLRIDRLPLRRRHG
jgi:hypothetical protein